MWRELIEEEEKEKENYCIERGEGYLVGVENQTRPHGPIERMDGFSTTLLFVCSKAIQ